MTDKKQTSMFSFFLFIMAAWIIVLFFTIIAALPSSAIQLTKHQSKTVSMIYPQSWGFFSKDPREDSLNIYLLDADEELRWPNNSLKNVIGLNRYGRTQGIELGLMLEKLPSKEKWKDFTTGQDIKDTTFLKMKNESPSPRLKGKMIITYERITPWAWSQHTETKRTIKKYIGVDVN
ncbi:SdpA family antimicrobial peptide system protein [Bacillus velezensis]